MFEKVIDVSRYQGQINWEKVKLNGVQAAMIKTVSTGKNFGGLYIDPTFERNYAECKRLQIPVGVYYYTYAKTRNQVDKELELLRKVLTDKSFELPIAIDVEDNSLKAIGKQALTDLVIYAAQKIESWRGYAMVYTYVYYAQTQLDMGRLSAYDFWIADYGAKRPALAHGMWQYTNNGTVNGITGKVDLSHSYKDYPEIMERAKLNDFGIASSGPELVTYKVGPLSPGDAKQVRELAAKLQVPCVTI